MNKKTYITLTNLCAHYQVDRSFFSNLNDYGLIKIETIAQSQYIDKDKISEIEKILRIHNGLDVNIEGTDVIIYLLQKIERLQNDLNSVKNRLRIYEDL